MPKKTIRLLRLRDASFASEGFPLFVEQLCYTCVDKCPLTNRSRKHDDDHAPLGGDPLKRHRTETWHLLLKREFSASNFQKIILVIGNSSYRMNKFSQKENVGLIFPIGIQ
jgi:hypothetical protein